MKVWPVFTCAAASIAMLSFGATNAVAENVSNESLEAAPTEVGPGDTITLTGTCDYPEFTAPAPTESYFLEPTNLTGEKDDNGVWHLSGTTTVKDDAKPGKGSVLFECAPGDVGVAEFTILPAEAEPYAAIGIQDREIRPGQEVLVVASCQDPEFVSSKIESPVLTAPDLVRENGEPANKTLSALGRISVDAKPGTYPISFHCVDRKISGEFTVLGADPAQANPAKPQVPVKPKGAAETGSIEEPADGSAVLIGVGAAALFAAGGAGVWAHRRRA